MTAANESLADGLSEDKEIHITVTGRKSGRAITFPVSFVLEDHTLYLLPWHGSNTQWYKNVLKNPGIHIEARGAEGHFQAVFITDSKRVARIVKMFGERYSEAVLKQYYSTFDVAVVIELV